MSLLSRYRKQKDGFEQLLHLVESSPPKKKQNFLSLIDKEDHSWGALLRAKSLTFDRVYSWDDSTLKIVLGMLPVRLFAVMLEGREDLIARTRTLLPSNRKTEFDDLRRTESKTEAQVESAQATFIKKVRALTKSGHIKLSEVDPALSFHQTERRVA